MSDKVKNRKQTVQDCITQFNLPENPSITDEVLSIHNFPSKCSKKLAFLILTYEREATITELKGISDQPAALVRELRNEGFIFQDNGKNPPHYLYKNSNGETCRKIIGFKTPKARIKGKVQSIIQKSVAACISAIEIYNKPDFKYREETFSILLVNAWELLLKSKILLDNNNVMSSIQVIDRKSGEVKKNRSGNSLTIDINNAIKTLVDQKQIDDRCSKNIELLIEIRDNAIHYFNKGSDFGKKVQEIGTASLKNYITAINEWFGWDLSQYNFYLMPISFFHPVDIDSFSIHSQEKEIARMLDYFRKVETLYPSDEEKSYNITLQIKTEFVKSSTDSPALEVRYTNREDAPEVKVSEENIIINKYPLSYLDLTQKLRDKYSDFKVNKDFYAIKRKLEDHNKYGDKFCKVRYLDAIEKKGTNKTFYSTEIIKEFDKYYTRRKN
ncbi:MAG: DUF3644 domain-containing protein [Anaerolineae bacterium]|nr:DUF3644 domain-containing protein [Anaerolineae bacterium]